MPIMIEFFTYMIVSMIIMIGVIIAKAITAGCKKDMQEEEHKMQIRMHELQIAWKEREMRLQAELEKNNSSK